MKINKDIDLSELSFMKIGGKGKYLIEIENKEEVMGVLEISKKENLPIITVGHGSNTIFTDDFHDAIFLKNKNTEIIKTYENDEFVNIKVGAGVVFDDFVAWAVENNFSGIETLSGIPGTVGACPIQNIGAYGNEVSNVITNVEFFSIPEEKFYEISNKDCEFDYRESFFKKNQGKFIIFNVSFRLFKKPAELPQYKDLALYFLSKQSKNPSLLEIRNAVLEIRSSKLPNWKEKPNVGSFFKNIILKKELAETLKVKYPDMPVFNVDAENTKIPTGWLIEKVGFKGKEFGNIGIYEKSALVLYSNGKADFAELKNVIEKIQKEIKKEFDIELEVEPNIF